MAGFLAFFAVSAEMFYFQIACPHPLFCSSILLVTILLPVYLFVYLLRIFPTEL